MDVASFCTESRVLIVAGKGGVGKTTIAAALATMAAGGGLSVLLVELEGKPGLTASFGGTGALEYEETELSGGAPAGASGAGAGAAGASGGGAGSGGGGGAGAAHPGHRGRGRGQVRARRITPDDALLQYLADHGLRRISRRLLSSGMLDVVATAIPGIRDVLVLGRIKQLERDRAADLIVVDAPATGHAVTFLTSARGLLDAARGGPVRSQAIEVAEMLADPARVRVVLVTLPEELPVSETVEAAYLLEDRAGVHLGPVVVNDVDQTPGLGMPAPDAVAQAVGGAGGQGGTEAGGQAVGGAGGQGDDDRLAVPPGVVGALEAARRFRLERQRTQADQIARLARQLPLPQLPVPHLQAAVVGPEDLDTLAAALADGIEALGAAPAGRMPR